MGMLKKNDFFPTKKLLLKAGTFPMDNHFVGKVDLILIHFSMRNKQLYPFHANAWKIPFHYPGQIIGK